MDEVFSIKMKNCPNCGEDEIISSFYIDEIMSTFYIREYVEKQGKDIRTWWKYCPMCGWRLSRRLESIKMNESELGEDDPTRPRPGTSFATK